MVKSLCELQLQLSSGPRSNRKKQCKTKRKRGQNNATSKKNHGIGNFPNSKELVKFGETILRERCKVGVRKFHIWNNINKMLSKQKFKAKLTNINEVGLDHNLKL